MPLQLTDYTQLANYNKIVVTGPQRSGTRITTKIIAHDFGCKMVDEMRLKISSLQKFSEVMLEPNKMAIHCPALSSIVHLIDFPNTVVVFCFRDFNDIKKSQERIGWKHDTIERAKYFVDDTDPREQFEVKYHCWNIFQKPKMRVDFFENHYSSLSNHRLWINKELRSNFHICQTELKEKR